MRKPKKIFITGVSGLVGGHVARYFSQFDTALYCLVRADSKTGFIADLPVHLVYGDISDAEGIKRLTEGMDCIVHTAAKVGDWGTYGDFFDVNVTGTLHVLQAARRNGIPHVVVTGSVSSYGEEDSNTLKDESFPFRPHYPYAFDRIMPSGMNHYRETKAGATRLALDYFNSEGLAVTILEPAWIYGENEKGSGFYEYLKTVRSGVPWMPGSRKNTFHLIYAGDLARAYWLAVQNPPEGVRRCIIGNPEPENMHRIFSLFCKEAGIRPPYHIPKWCIYPLALVMEAWALLLKSPSPPLLTRSRVNMFYDSIGYSTEKAWRELGFRSETSLETGIRATVEWYKKNNWL